MMVSVWVSVARAVAALLVVAVLLTPAAAVACPSCATREGPGAGTLVLVGLMILVPYVVAVVALRVIRRLDRDPR
jgi:hypothetical protein